MNGLLIIGSGFAGMWAAVTAAYERQQAGGNFPIRMVSPDSHIVIRPRLYEADPDAYRVSLTPTLEPIGVDMVDGTVTAIHPAASNVRASMAGGETSLDYDKLVLAAGSVLKPLPVPGLGDHGFDIDSWAGAVKLDRHLAGLATQDGPGNDTFAIVGAGFTGIELATEMRDRLAAHGADGERATILLIEQADDAGPELGAGPRDEILAALADARVDLRLNCSVEAVSAETVTLSNGETLPCCTVVNTAGLVASPIAKTLGAQVDDLGRLPTDDQLRVLGFDDIYAAGDIARAEVDDAGHIALMSCQHGMPMGKAAGYNAARSLVGLEPRPYRQERYVTCLDLGRRGAVLTSGWDRQVEATGADAKARKQLINGQIIYPPVGSREEILAAGDIDRMPGR